MSRSLSSTLEAAIYAASTSEVFLFLLTLDPNESGKDIQRIVNDTKNITSNGNVFTAFPFQLNLPSDAENRPPEAEVTIDAVDRSMISFVRDLSSEASAKIEVILASDPDTVELTIDNLVLRDVNYNATTISGRLGIGRIADEIYPKDLMGPADFPGLF